MNAWLVIAAVFACVLGAAHSYLGERYILMRLFRRPDLPALFGTDWFTKRTLRFAWHLTTVAWFGIAAAFLSLAVGSPRLAVQSLAAAFLVSAAVTAVASHGRHLAWPVFLLVAIGAWLGAPVA